MLQHLAEAAARLPPKSAGQQGSALFDEDLMAS
jgi:hypothetical protein